jgi:hypothetical protein
VSEAHIVAGRYVLNQLLGRGGVGEVWRATQQPLGRVVALKLLREEYAGNPQIMRRFGREARAASGLAHPNIASVFDHGTDDLERLYIAMELIEGISLTEAIEKGLSVRNTLELADQLLAGLAHAHARGVIHRDLKPANLMLNSKGRIVLIDFGAVREAVTADGVGSTIVGTFGYMPPEQYAGQSTPATDLFALGATLVQLITRQAPGELFEGLHHFKIPAGMPITVGFERILLRLTEPEVARRYQSAKEVKSDLDEGFLMVPTKSVTGLLPIPHEILPAPRPFPGFFLRDAYHGKSHLFIVLMALASVVLVTTFPIALYLSGGAVFAIPGLFAVFVCGTLAYVVTKKARIEIDVYRRGIYTLGEITGIFWSDNTGQQTNLTYRYRVGEGFRHGSISTTDGAYSTLGPGDPVGVIYLPEEPEEHVMYAVPTKWAVEQNKSVQQRLASDEVKHLPA